MIDVAIHLCIEQGYDNTTVEQIAAGAEIAPRTFSRYFPNKEAVIVAILAEVADDVAACYARQPRDITEYEALLRAIWRPSAARDGDPDSAAFDRMRLLLTIVNSAPAIGLGRSCSGRTVTTRRSTCTAGGWGSPAGDPAIRILVRHVGGGDGRGLSRPRAPGRTAGRARRPVHRIESTYGVFTRLWTP